MPGESHIDSKTVWNRIFEKDRLKWKRPDEKVILLGDELVQRGLKKIYDLGCGSGRHTTYFARRNFEVCASDISVTALKRTENGLSEEGLSATLIQTDMTGQPFRDSAFDAVVSYGVLFHNTLPKIRQSIEEIRRILMPGGLFFATFQSLEDWKHGRGQELEEDTFVLEEPDHAERGQVHHFFTEASVLNLLKGFRVVELEQRKHKDVFYHPEENLQYAIWIAMAEKPCSKDYTLAGKASPVEQLLNPRFARDFFRQNTASLGWAGHEVMECSVTPFHLSKRGGKAVLEFNILLRALGSSKPTSKTIIAKWRPDIRNREIFLLMQDLWNNGFQGQDHLKICQPIAYLQESNLMLTSKAEGVELDKILLAGSGRLDPYIERAARWLAKLHETRITHTRNYTVEMEEEKLNMWLRHLSSLHPPAAETLSNLADQLLKAERAVDSQSYSPIHGDFHPKNIFIYGEDLTAIDFEQSVTFDPAKDLGYFAAQLDMKSVKYHLAQDPRRLRQLFLDEYKGRPSDGISERVSVYEAMTYLQHLHFIYWTLKRNFDLSDFEHWIGRAGECIRMTS